MLLANRERDHAANGVCKIRRDAKRPKYLYHFTSKSAARRIEESRKIFPSLQEDGDALMGNGVYVTHHPRVGDKDVILRNNYGAQGRTFALKHRANACVRLLYEDLDWAGMVYRTDSRSVFCIDVGRRPLYLRKGVEVFDLMESPSSDQIALKARSRPAKSKARLEAKVFEPDGRRRSGKLREAMSRRRPPPLRKSSSRSKAARAAPPRMSIDKQMSSEKLERYADVTEDFNKLMLAALARLDKSRVMNGKPKYETVEGMIDAYVEEAAKAGLGWTREDAESEVVRFLKRQALADEGGEKSPDNAFIGIFALIVLYSAYVEFAPLQDVPAQVISPY